MLRLGRGAGEGARAPSINKYENPNCISTHNPTCSQLCDRLPSTRKIDGGIEYYGALGPLSGFDPKSEQQHQIFPAIDLNVSPKWEFNFGVGIGLTRSTDHLIFKMIIGRRFTFSQQDAKAKDSSPD